MAESSWPTIAGGRAVTDDQWELMASALTVDGIVSPHTDPTPVFGDSSGRQVKVRANKIGVIGGHGWTSGSTDTVKTIGANSSGSTRIDLVVLGLDRTTWAATTYVVAGTPGSGTPPALTRGARGSSAGKWEIPLASVNVVNGAATITASDVTDLTWYNHGGQISTKSTNPLQPPVADYPRLRHTDTDVEYVPVSGAWKRLPGAQNVIAGKTYNGSAVISAATLFLGSYSDLTIRTGSAAMLSGRRYRIEWSFLTGYSATSDVAAAMSIQVRKPAGTVIGTVWSPIYAPTVAGALQGHVEYLPSSDETLDLQMWGQCGRHYGTTLNWIQLYRPGYFRVVDLGLASTLTSV